MLLRPVTFPTAWKRVAATWWLIRTFMKCLRRKKKGSALITPMDGTNFRHNIAVGSPTVDPHNQKKVGKNPTKGLWRSADSISRWPSQHPLKKTLSATVPFPIRIFFLWFQIWLLCLTHFLFFYVYPSGLPIASNQCRIPPQFSWTETLWGVYLNWSRFRVFQCQFPGWNDFQCEFSANIHQVVPWLDAHNHLAFNSIITANPGVNRNRNDETSRSIEIQR